jgi:uncharacterized caspase-like protein
MRQEEANTKHLIAAIDEAKTTQQIFPAEAKTAQNTDEVSPDKDDLRHGVFTHLLLDGLEGKADIDRDRVIIVDKGYHYVPKNVPGATGQEQYPVQNPIHPFSELHC